jgi:hypothetical protein
MGKDYTPQPLTPAQRPSAARYPWYAEFLLSTGRTAEEVYGKKAAK